MRFAYGVTANVAGPLVPPAVVTVTLWLPSVAAPPIVNLAVTCDESTNAKLPAATLTPPPTFIVVPIAVKLVPVRVTFTPVPRAPVPGETDASVGAAGFETVNGTVPVFPPGTTTATLWIPKAAPFAIRRFAVTVESLTTMKFVTVMLPPGATLSPVAALKF